MRSAVSMFQLRVLLFSSLAASVLGLPTSPLHAESKPNLRAGAATTDTTPQQGVSLDGPISKNGPVTGVHDRLHARAIVLDDGTTRLAIVICDACMIGRDVFDAAKKMVQHQTGFPTNRMLMAATHTHAAVRAVHIGTEPADERYHKLLARRIADAVIEAEKNLAPARMGFSSFDKPDFVRCRRFLCEPGSVGVNPFGKSGERIKSVAGRSSAVIKAAGPVDPQFSILSIQHIDGSPLAVLGNFKEESPHRYTFTIELANGYGGYLPTREQHRLGGYETWPARSSFLEVKAESKIRAEVLRLLQDIGASREE